MFITSSAELTSLAVAVNPKTVYTPLGGNSLTQAARAHSFRNQLAHSHAFFSRLKPLLLDLRSATSSAKPEAQVPQPEAAVQKQATWPQSACPGNGLAELLQLQEQCRVEIG